MAYINKNKILFSANVNTGSRASASGVVSITNIDTVYDAVANLPSDVSDGTTFLVINNDEKVVCLFYADAMTWKRVHNLQSHVAYIVLKGDNAGVYRYNATSPYLVLVESHTLHDAKAYTDEKVEDVEVNAKAYTDEKVEDSENNAKAYTDELAERVTDLESLTHTFAVDTSIAYEKTVPAEVGKYAVVKSIISKTIKNEINPESVSFGYNFGGIIPTTQPAPCEMTVNDDGSLTVRTYYRRATTSIYNSQLRAGKYYLHIECDNEVTIVDHRGYFSITLEASSSGGTFNLKMMLWKYEDSDIVEITHSPVGTVFVPYNAGVKNIKIDRIESVGADGVTVLGTLNIPKEVQVLDGYGREDTYIEWNDDGTITLTVTKDVDLNDLSSPNVVDVTKYFVDSNVIEVVEGGIIRSVNNFNYPVTTTIVYSLNVVDSLILAGRETQYKAYVNNKLEECKEQSKEYADSIKNDLLNGAGEAYDTLKELGDALEGNKDVIATLVSKDLLQKKFNDYDATMVQRLASMSDDFVPVTTEANKIYGTDENGNQKEYPLAIKYTDTGIVQRVGGGYISQPNPTQNWHGSTKEYTDRKDNEVKAYADSRINPLEERVADLESLTLTFTEDTSTDYEKAVPAEVGKYALVKMIGGATEKVYSKNMLNPIKLSFYTYDNETGISYTLNADGTITYTIGHSGYCFFDLWDLPVGRYYLYLENASIDLIDMANIDIVLSADYNPDGGNMEPTTKTLKVMVWRDESVTTEDYEIVEAPEGTVFEPYHKPYFQDAEVERVESIGADGETLLGSITIPFEAIKARVDGFGEMVNDTYYDYIEFVDDKVFGYKVTDEIVLNGTEDGWVKYATSQTPYFYIPSFLPNFVPAECTSNLYNQTKISITNQNIGITTGTVGGNSGTLLVRPPNYAELTLEGFKAQLAEKPITFRYAFETPVVTDITDLFTEGNKLQVQQGGSIRFVNERKIPIPNTIAYVTRKG